MTMSPGPAGPFSDPAASSSHGSSSAGLDLGAAHVAVARYMARDVLLYHGPTLQRTLHTIQGPTAVHYLPQFAACSTNLLAVAEEHQVSA